MHLILGKVGGCLRQRSSTLLLGTHSPGKFISNRLQHTCLQFSSSLEELDWPLQVCLIRVVAKLSPGTGLKTSGLRYLLFTNCTPLKMKVLY